MKKFLEKKEGITLIALVITIIIMIVLASVSINAIVGDNGIITQAQNATVQNSIANLEEYLKELYVENYDTVANSSYESKVEALAGISAYKYYFYNPSRDSSVGALSYISTSDGYVLYLINKSELPDEIQDLLIGGDAGDGEYADYATLNDVYGVTKDLKVYYCSGGVDTITGIASTELDTDNLSRVVFSSLSDSKVYNLSWYNLLSSYDTNSDGELTVQELRSVKVLTISSSAGISSLSELYNLTSLGELTLEGLTIDNIDGIENALQIYYVFFKSCVIQDYSALCELSKLTYLYFYDIDDDELETACADIAAADFSKLTYLAVVGRTDYINNIAYISCKHISNVTVASKTVSSLEPLSQLSSVTKNAVKYLTVHNNNIEGDLSDLCDYSNLIFLRCNCNKLTSLSGLENMNNLVYLQASMNEIGTGATDSTDTSLLSLANKTNLFQVYLEDNESLAYVDDLKEDSAIRYLYLAGCSSEMIINNIADIILLCGDNYSLPVKFLTGSVYNASSYYTVSEVSFSELKSDLKWNTYITCLNLEGVTNLTNNELNEILETMINLQYVTLRYCTNLTSIDFVHELTEDEDGNQTGVTGLIELDLISTNVTDLTNLNDYAMNLNTLRVGNTKTNLTEIQDVISRLGLVSNSSAAYWYATSNRGLNISNSTLAKQLENCTSITRLFISQHSLGFSFDSLDLSNCTSLTYLWIDRPFISKVFAPYSLEYYYGGNPVYLSDGTDYISSYNFTFNTSLSSEDLSEFMTSLGNCEHFDSLTLDGLDVGEDLSYLEKLSNSTIDSLNIGNTANTSYTCYSSLSGVEYLKNSGITSFYATRVYTLADISSISSLDDLVNLDLQYSGISGLLGLEELNELVYLNLQNTSFYDVSEDKNGNAYNNLQILINLYNYGSLRKLYLSGNSSINTESDEYQTLIGLNWIAKDF